MFDATVESDKVAALPREVPVLESDRHNDFNPIACNSHIDRFAIRVARERLKILFWFLHFVFRGNREKRGTEHSTR